LEGEYKYGRSTTREGSLLKLKKFEDSEALVIGMEEKMHNDNELQTNELGYAKRTSHIANLVPLGTMGALIVRDLRTGVVFNIGTGFTDQERAEWWAGISSKEVVKTTDSAGGLIVMINDPNTVVKYRYFPNGSKGKPRFPTYLGIRV
jgi:DNA ligase-1